MSRRARGSKAVNNYIYGGIGGPGGEGRNRGQGGTGGIGQGPTLNYHINSEHFAVNNHSGSSVHSSGINVLHHAVALEALHDSAESFPQPKCHPETRKELLNKLYHWATDPGSTSSINWLHGPAGAGKSAVMQSLCQQLKDAGQLSASFFFKREHLTRGNAKVLFATLAYQLALHRGKLRNLITQLMETDPSIIARGMDVQLRTLIVEPCKLLQDTTRVILLIDGLDECEGHNIQQEILHLIRSTTKDNGCLRILLASRPEPHIRDMFEDEFFQGLFESTNIQQSFIDVRTYLCAEFLRIHRKHHTMRSIAAPWPSPHILEMLVKKSSGYFIYASTVIKFVDDEYSRPSTQLNIVLNIVPHDSESPCQNLDELYIRILSGVPVRYHPRLCDILSVIIHYPPGIMVSVEEMDELLGFQSGDVSLILRPLHSVLKLGSKEDEIEVHHASFRDFLASPERSSVFYVGSTEHRAQLAHSILKALAYTHDDRQKNHGNFGLHWKGPWINYITSVPPSAEFAPLVRLVNPDFVFLDYITADTVQKLLIWLKGINPVPDDLIQHWEDYIIISRYSW
ncbi:putative nwd2 protein [Mycena venus]|uniref:Putative nwd2 protein n=1 Tax=Mycena venus TaxID=2733690 RepID=A0A8H6Y6F2_9AGAR|nr:putative nwd2 protein [Mycena venus]